MVVHIRKNAPKGKVKKTLKTITPKKSKINLDAYFGKVNYGVDGLTYQKQIREKLLRAKFFLTNQSGFLVLQK